MTLLASQKISWKLKLLNLNKSAVTFFCHSTGTFNSSLANSKSKQELESFSPKHMGLTHWISKMHRYHMTFLLSSFLILLKKGSLSSKEKFTDGSLLSCAGVLSVNMKAKGVPVSACTCACAWVCMHARACLPSWYCR